MRDKAKQYYKEHLQGTSVRNPILGEVNLDDDVVNFTGRGIKKAISSSAGKNKLFLVKYLPDLIENADEVNAKPNNKSKREASQYTYFKSSAVIDGKPQDVIVTVFTDANGNHYYNHNITQAE